MTRELLELLGVLEATVARQPALSALLDGIIDGPLLTSAELPEPAPQEREAPAVRRSVANVEQTLLGL
jgi:hypothetical protein